MSKPAWCIGNNRNFAWLEFEETADGVVFTRVFQDKGWRNLMEDLIGHPPKKDPDGETRAWYEDTNRDLEVRMFSANIGGGKRQAVLWIPSNSIPGSKHKEDTFTQQWLVNPGCIPGTLIFGNEPGAKFADMLVLSGHGSHGAVFGQRFATQRNELAIDENGFVLIDGDTQKSYPSTHTWAMSNILSRIATPSNKRLKYLILPCCSNVGRFNTLRWLRVFNKGFDDDGNPIPGKEGLRMGLRVILGYPRGYPGGDPGAQIMDKFARLLFPEDKSKEQSILACWAQANEEHESTWGALFVEGAEEDKMSQWVTNQGLPDLKPGDGGKAPRLRYHNQGTWPKDKSRILADSSIVTPKEPDVLGRFWMNHWQHPTPTLSNPSEPAKFQLAEVRGMPPGKDSKGNDLEGNNDNLEFPQLGFDVGRVARLEITSPVARTLKAGQVLTVIIYMYRENHGGADWTKLVDFTLTESQSKRHKISAGLNPWLKPTGAQAQEQNAFTYELSDKDAEGQRELANQKITLFFRGHDQALDTYKEELERFSRGYFWIDVIGPAPTGESIPKPGADRGVLSTFERAPHRNSMGMDGVHLHPHRPVDPKKLREETDKFLNGTPKKEGSNGNPDTDAVLGVLDKIRQGIPL